MIRSVLWIIVTSIQGGKYAVYRFDGLIQDIFGVFQGIFNIWLPSSRYEMDERKAKSAGLSCANGELYLQFSFCSCPMLADVDKLDTDTWCQCTTGYSKVLFEKAFACEVDVELLKSIKTGDEICLMKIIPQGVIWK